MLHPTVDDAAVRHHGVDGDRFVHVAGGHFIAHFGVDGPILPEEVVPQLGIEHVQIELEVALDAVHAVAQIMIFVALHF